MTNPIRVIGAANAAQFDIRPIFSPQTRVIKRRVVDRVEAVGEAIDAMHADAQRRVEDAKIEADRIRAEAMQRGHAEGLRQALSELAVAQKVHADARRAAEQEMLDLAFGLAARIVGRAVRLDPSIMTEIVRERTAELASAARIVVRVSPDAAAHLERDREMLSRHVDGVPLVFLADDALDPGDCVVETDRGRADARIHTQLRALRAAIVIETAP